MSLAVLSMARHSDPERFAGGFSGRDRTVAEYLLAEVLERQPEEVTSLLLRTSMLERVSGPLADRLTGGSAGPEGSVIAFLVLLLCALLVHLRFPKAVYPDRPA